MFLSEVSPKPGTTGVFYIEELLNGIMNLRKVKPVERWRIVLKAVFEEADRDQSGTISRDEFSKVLCSATTLNKFERLGIGFTKLESLFENLSGEQELTEESLIKGFTRIMSGQDSQKVRNSYVVKDRRPSAI